MNNQKNFVIYCRVGSLKQLSSVNKKLMDNLRIPPKVYEKKII